MQFFNINLINKNREKLQQRNILRVERLLSLNQKEFGNTSNNSLMLDHKNETKFSFHSRKNTLQIKLECLDDSFTIKKNDMSNLNQNYWARLAYRQTQSNSDRQYRNF